MNRNSFIVFLLLVFLLCACSSTKYVGENEFLLNKMKIKVEGGKVSADNLNDYVYQKPNADMLFIPKAGLHVYSLSGRDTSKLLNKMLRSIGSAPVVYDENATISTEKQLVKKMQNLGYLNAEASYCLDTVKKKVNLTYCVRPDERYYIRHFSTDVSSTDMRNLLRMKKISKLIVVEDESPFVPELFDQISTDLTTQFWNMGYYNLSKDNFYFLADTSVGDHHADVTLMYRERKDKNDSTGVDLAVRRYRFRNVTIHNGLEENRPLFSKRRKEEHDTIYYHGVRIINGKDLFLRPAVLENNLFIRPQRYYGDQLVDKTYNALNTLGAVGQVGITLKEADSPQDSACLDADIKLTKSNIYHFQFGVDGTNTAGDFGVASYVSFQQKNLFRGAEMLSFKLTGAFERIKGNEEYNLETDNYYEYGGDVSFSVPRIMLPVMAKYKRQVGASTTFAFGCNWRKRPEYDRQFLSLDWKYSWYTNRKKIFHTFDFYNINYVVSKNTSKWFSAYLERTGNELLKESYKDQFITRSSYSVVYSENSSSGTLKGWSFRGGIDIAGTMPYLFCSALQKGDSVYTIANTPFAQYFKAMFDVSKNFFIKSKTQLVAHVGLGIAMPYGNSLVIPYEQRFFAGGANTLRGWSTRTLGPGSFDSHDSGNFITQTGDVKIVLNLEYRQQTNTFLDVAAFLDAGNIWTVKDYETQKNGQFNIAGFYKEMGFSWGLGIRPNFKFIVLRLDAGMQLFSPTDGWVALHPSWKNTCALHFAVGYPF